VASVISIDFDAPFDVQAAQARAQGVVLPEYYYGVLQAEKRKYAQTVSSLAGLDQIQPVVDKLAEWQAEGKTLAEFKKWAKTQEWTLPKGRLETIYRNSVQTAYQAGHWRDFEENKDERPYLMYDAINDSRTRPSHLALDNTIKPVDDPFWDTCSPPLGHRCRCSLRSLSPREAMHLGGVTQNVPAEGGPDEGWGSKPTEWGDTLERLKAEKLAKAAPAVADAVENMGMTPHPHALPNFSSAIISDEKLLSYSLNPDHPRGGNKAKVFASALGFTLENAEQLKSEILRLLPTIHAVEREKNQYGQSFSVDIPMTGPTGSAIVRTGWIVDSGEEFPRLVSTYVLRK